MGNNCFLYKVSLKSCYFDIKDIKNFSKGVGRLQDKKRNSIWFEVTGSYKAEVKTRASKLLAGKAGTYTSLEIKSSSWYVGGRCLDANPTSGMKCSPVA